MAGHIPFGKGDGWLRATRSLWLASTRPNGRPHAAPVWFIWDGWAIYFSTEPTSEKHRNLQHQSLAVAHLGDGDDVLIAEGHVAVVRDAVELRTVDRLSRQKYVDPHSGVSAGYPQFDVDVPYRIDIERIMIWEYGVVATSFPTAAVVGQRRHAPDPSSQAVPRATPHPVRYRKLQH